MRRQRATWQPFPVQQECACRAKKTNRCGEKKGGGNSNMLGQQEEVCDDQTDEVLR